MPNSSVIINKESVVPKPISIITVCYNAVDELKITLNSLEAQSSDQFEYVIVDGASRDGSLLLLEEHSAIIDRLISEKDKGIYDAMNKAIKLARGNYLLFLNAGDSLYDKDVIKKLLKEIEERQNPACIYGDAMLVNEKGEELGLRKGSAPPKLDWKSLKMGMDVCHQAFLVKRSICPDYNTRYRIAADIDWMIRILKKCGEIEKSDMVISNFLIGGFSSKILYKSWLERFRVLRKHYGFLPTLFNHFRILIKNIG